MSKKAFDSDREAKEFLVGKIVAEAKREGVSLSEIERKMLYFSETDWTLPGILEVNAEFERDYDEGEYERKIAGLIRKIRARNGKQGETEKEEWDSAVEKLEEGDHYLLVMIQAAHKAPVRMGAARPPHDRLKLVLTAFACIIGLFLIEFLLERMFGPDWRENSRYFWQHR